MLSTGAAISQTNDSIQEQSDQENIKKGLSFGVLPVIGYSSDLGFQYGIIFNLFGYGDLAPQAPQGGSCGAQHSRRLS